MRGNNIVKVLFGFMLTAALVIGCSDSEEASQSNDLNENESTEEQENNENGESGDKLFDEVTELSMFNRNHPSWPYDEDQYIWDWLTEKTNVELDMMAVEGSNYTEQLNLTIASGDMPDIYWALDYNIFNEYGQDGAFIDLMEYEELMPNMFQLLEDDPTILQNAMAADGGLYMAPSYNDGASGRRGYLHREDIFEEHNLDTPDTWEEMYEVSKELQEIYPGSYPFIFRSDFAHFHMITPQFDMPGSEFYLDPETEQWTFAPVKDEYKVMVEWLNTFYEEGLIPPDWLSINQEAWQEYIMSEESFMTVDYNGTMLTFNPTMQEENPDFSMKFMPPPAGFEGAPQHNFNADLVERGMAVSSLSDNIEEALTYIDWFYTDEAIEFVTLGKEGVTHEIVDGEVEMLYDTQADFNIETGVGNNGTFLVLDDFQNLHGFAIPELEESLKVIEEYDAPQVLTQPILNSAESNETSVLRESISTRYQEQIGRFIIGERSLDEWDEYVEEINDLGLQDLLNTYQQSYDRLQ